MAKSDKDIALASAIIAIDHLTGDVAVISMPDEERRRDRFTHVFGACDPYWSENSEESLRGELLIYIWYAVALYGVEPSALHAALMVIPEYRHLMPAVALTAKD